MDELRQSWDRDGYAVLRGAAPPDVVAAYAEDLARVREGLLIRAPGEDQVSLAIQHDADPAAVAIDPYAISDAARALLLAPPIVAALTALGGEPPLLFDAAGTGAAAPDDGPYRDATFTALADAPETLMIYAVATGDAAVVVHPGSQRIATTPFSGRYRHFNAERDGEGALRRHRDELAAGLAEHATTETIALTAGDAVLWAPDLVHLPVTGAALVAHAAPAGVRPGWFAYRPERAAQAAYEDGAAWLTSQHYDLVDAIVPADAPAGVQDEGEIQRIGETLREHDEELAIEPQPGAPSAQPGAPSAQPPEGGSRRGGGLVDSVRGILGRRGRR